MITMTEIARLTGVSQPTVSRLPDYSSFLEHYGAG